MSSDSLLLAALAFIRAGVSILPIDSRTKRPAMNLLPKDENGKATWKPYQEKIADEATVRGWIAAGIEAKRVYGVLAESPEDRDQRRLVELVQAKGGRATVRELMRRSRLYASSAEWEQALADLVFAGVGRWETPVSTGPGRPKPSVFVLLTEPRDGASVDTLTVDTIGENSGKTSDSVNCQHVNSEPSGAAVNAAEGRERGEL